MGSCASEGLCAIRTAVNAQQLQDVEEAWNLNHPDHIGSSIPVGFDVESELCLCAVSTKTSICWSFCNKLQVGSCDPHLSCTAPTSKLAVTKEARIIVLAFWNLLYLRVRKFLRDSGSTSLTQRAYQAVRKEIRYTINIV